MTTNSSGICVCGCGLSTRISPYTCRRNGWVKGEYRRFRPGHHVAKPLAERFWSQVNKSGPVPSHMSHLGNCWLWTGHSFERNGERRGLIRIEHRGKQKPVTHAAFILAGEPLEPGKQALHHCDNSLCVRFSHLFSGTRSDNSRDCAAKGRTRLQKNPLSSPTRKLMPQDVTEIRSELSLGATRATLARQFHVTWQCIDSIKAGRTWTSA